MFVCSFSDAQMAEQLVDNISYNRKVLIPLDPEEEGIISKDILDINEVILT